MFLLLLLLPLLLLFVLCVFCLIWGDSTSDLFYLYIAKGIPFESTLGKNRMFQAQLYS